MRAVEEPLALVADLERQGIRFSVKRGRLIARPANRLTPELAGMLRANRALIASALRERQPDRELVTDPAAAACPPSAETDDIPVPRFRVVVDRLEPLPSPVEVLPGVRVIDVRLAINGLLRELRCAVLLYGESCSDGGDDRLYRLAVEAGEEIDRLLVALARLGCDARVVPVQ